VGPLVGSLLLAVARISWNVGDAGIAIKHPLATLKR
jgi:hypothetical protein